MAREKNEAEKLLDEILEGIGFGIEATPATDTEEAQAAIAPFDDYAGSAPIGKAFRWGARGDNPVVFEVGKPVPLRGYEAFRVFALFHDADEVRVYAVPVEKGPGDRLLNPARLTLTKLQPSAFEEEFVFDVFKECLREEFDALAPDEEEEDEEEQKASAPAS